MKFSKKKGLIFLIALLIFFDVEPYFVWPITSNKHLGLILSMFTLLLIWLNKKKFTIIDVKLFSFFLLALLLMGILYGLNIWGIITIIILVVIPFGSPTFMIKAYHKFIDIYSIVLLGSIIVMLLVVLGASIPHYTILPLNKLKVYDYTAYPFLVIPNKVFNTFLVFKRFPGPFDEPGVIGTISLLILYIEKFNFKKWKNIVIFLSGILSFSLFFYIASFIFAAYYVFINKVKTIYRIVVIISVFTLIILSMENVAFSNYILARIQWDSESSSIIGDNRAQEDLKSYFNKIKGTSIYFWGLGLVDRDLMQSFDGSAGYRNAILRYGLVGCLLYILFFVSFAYQRLGLKRNFFLFLVLFLSTLYQRPGFLSIHYIFLFVSFIMINSKIENSIYRKTQQSEIIKIK